MSLEEIKKKIEAMKAKEEQKKRQQKEKKELLPEEKSTHQRKEHQKIIDTAPDSIQANIGDLTILLTQDHVNSLLEKLWKLDFHSNKELDSAINKYFDEEGKMQKLILDKARLIETIRSTAFFKFPDGNMLSYNSFRQDWQYYVGEDKPLYLSGKRKEFVQLLTNHYKPNWVKSNGKPLSEEEFQILYRLEREPRAIERIIEYIESNYFNFVQKDSMEEYLTKIRTFIARIIKDQLLNIVKTKQMKEK